MSTPASLADWQAQVWQQVPNTPQTWQEALDQLDSWVQRAKQALQESQLLEAQERVEDAFLSALLAIKTFEISPETATRRSLVRAWHHRYLKDSVMKIFADRAEWWVGETCRGQWFLFSDEDRLAALTTAKELNCAIEDSPDDLQQLNLFRG
jgi:hypothetical protein